MPNYTPWKSWVSDEVFLGARKLENEHLQNCRVFPNRLEMLRILPKNARVVEVGTAEGWFATRILETIEPVELHLIDINLDNLTGLPRDMADRGSIVQLHGGQSADCLAQLPDHSFDLIYIDADHSFDGVMKDAIVAIRKIKPDGYLVFNDYTAYSPREAMTYGVMRAVHDVCLDFGFEMVGLALEDLGYMDVALRRRAK